MSHPTCYSVSMIIKIEAIKPLASQRTRNRIREHGGKGFILERRNDNAFPPMWLVRAPRDPWDGEGSRTGWLGWLPINEFRVIDTKESD